MKDVLSISEILRTLEGESTFAGTPCALVRLAGCDSDCAWCDAKAGNIRPGRLMKLAEIHQEIRDIGTDLVVLTGGEPLLQRDTPALARQLSEAGHTVIVDTSGSCDISELPAPIIRLMDIKTLSSGMSHRMNWYNLSHLRPADEVKFVIADRKDYEYAREIIEKHGLTGKSKLLFTPLWGKMDAAELGEWILWDDLRARLQVQLRKMIGLKTAP
jgi:7-carboxy-7-deazaguanine synthase